MNIAEATEEERRLRAEAIEGETQRLLYLMAAEHLSDVKIKRLQRSVRKLVRDAQL